MIKILILCILSLMAIMDIKTRQVPILYQVLLLVLVPFCFKIENLLGVAIAIPFFIAMFLTDKIGGGDAKVMLLLGILTGYYCTLFTVILGCMVFILSGLVTIRIKERTEFPLPFIPSLTIGYTATIVLEAIF